MRLSRLDIRRDFRALHCVLKGHILSHFREQIFFQNRRHATSLCMLQHEPRRFRSTSWENSQRCCVSSCLSDVRTLEDSNIETRCMDRANSENDAVHDLSSERVDPTRHPRCASVNVETLSVAALPLLAALMTRTFIVATYRRVASCHCFGLEVEG